MLLSEPVERAADPAEPSEWVNKYRLYHEKEGNTGFKSPRKPIV